MGLPPLNSSGLGNLAQAARGKQLKQARGILMAIGILTILVNGLVVTTARSQVKTELDKEVRKLQAQGMVIDQEKLQAAEDSMVRFGSLVASGAILLGVLFVVFGLIIKRYPVAITVTSLVLYIGAAVVFGVLDPATLASGLLIKILIVVGLVKAIQAAVAYQKEEAAQVSPELSV